MTTTAEAVLLAQREMKTPVEIPGASNPKIAQIVAMLAKLDDKGLTLAAALIVQLAKFSEPMK